LTFYVGYRTEYSADSSQAFCFKERYECACEESRMHILTLSILSVLVGWLATLILLSDLESCSLLDLGVGITGAALVGGLLAPFLGISTTTGEYGLTLSGTVMAWLGALILLALVNLARHGHILCGRRQRHGHRKTSHFGPAIRRGRKQKVTGM